MSGHLHVWASHAIVLELDAPTYARIATAWGPLRDYRIVYKRCYCGAVLL